MKSHPILVARELRRNQTPQEKLLWRNVRNRKLCGLKFLRQHAIILGGPPNRPEFFGVDFLCAEKKLVIEVDGGIHDLQYDYDKYREHVLFEMGYKVIRFRNEGFDIRGSPGENSSRDQEVEEITMSRKQQLPPLCEAERGCPFAERTGVSQQKRVAAE